MLRCSVLQICFNGKIVQIDIGYTCAECRKQGHAATPTFVSLRQIILLTLQASRDNNYIDIVLKNNLFSNQAVAENNQYQ